jgi:hypothetical protein
MEPFAGSRSGIPAYSTLSVDWLQTVFRASDSCAFL